MSTTTWPGATPRRADNVELARYRREVRVGRVLLLVLVIAITHSRCRSDASALRRR
jgi:hypothetical protein